MSILKPISENDASEKVKNVFEEIKVSKNVNVVPNFWRTIANNSDTLECTWNSVQQVMKEGSLNSLFKELIYIAVSMTNSCEYCIRSHTKSAQTKGISDEMPNELIAVVAMANETSRLVESHQVEVDENLK